MKKKDMKVRIALRQEGDWWNAYIAQSNTMKNAKLIGSIQLGSVKRNKEIKDAFIAVMQMVLSDAIKEVTGVIPTEWEFTKAPESERSGHG